MKVQNANKRHQLGNTSTCNWMYNGAHTVPLTVTNVTVASYIKHVLVSVLPYSVAYFGKWHITVTFQQILQ